VAAIARADAGVVALRRDRFRDVSLAGKMFDYIAMGKPVVSSRTRSVEETFGPSSVELFESGDAADLARALRRLYRSPQRRTELAARAREVAAAYQWSRQREIYRGVVDGLITSRAGRATPRRPVSDRERAGTPPRR
jgi:glycosyltransferase involved in cell wall biosynthesis